MIYNVYIKSDALPINKSLSDWMFIDGIEKFGWM
jgi:hypothetical protein